MPVSYQKDTEISQSERKRRGVTALHAFWYLVALYESQMSQSHWNATARLQGLRAQVRDYFALQGQRRKLFPRALLVGLLAGRIAVAFRWTLDGGDILRNRGIV